MTQTFNHFSFFNTYDVDSIQELYGLSLYEDWWVHVEDVPRLLVDSEPDDSPATPDSRVVQGVSEERIIHLEDGQGVAGLPVADSPPIHCRSPGLDRVTAQLCHVRLSDDGVPAHIVDISPADNTLTLLPYSHGTQTCTPSEYPCRADSEILC